MANVNTTGVNDLFPGNDALQNLTSDEIDNLVSEVTGIPVTPKTTETILDTRHIIDSTENFDVMCA